MVNQESSYLNPSKQTQHLVIFFDEVCVLCNRLVQWLIRLDKEKRFRFYSLKDLKARIPINSSDELPDSILTFYRGHWKIRSAAALEIIKNLGWPWKLFLVFKLIPRAWNDKLYKLLARNRYHWFGKYADCPLPSDELKQRLFSESELEALLNSDPVSLAS